MPKIHLGLFIKYNKCKPHNHKFSYIRQQWPLVHLINSLLNIKVVRFDSSITCPAIAFDHKKIGQDHCTGIMSGVGQYWHLDYLLITIDGKKFYKFSYQRYANGLVSGCDRLSDCPGLDLLVLAERQNLCFSYDCLHLHVGHYRQVLNLQFLLVVLRVFPADLQDGLTRAVTTDKQNNQPGKSPTFREAFCASSCSYSFLIWFTSALSELFSSFNDSTRWANSSHSA